MKIFLEADFTKGNGALRWEGVTNRRLKRLMGSVVVIVGLSLSSGSRAFNECALTPR